MALHILFTLISVNGHEFMGKNGIVNHEFKYSVCLATRAAKKQELPLCESKRGR